MHTQAGRVRERERWIGRGWGALSCGPSEFYGSLGSSRGDARVNDQDWRLPALCHSLRLRWGGV
eukprot:761454-Hanusia_phi.AAC.3